MKKRPKRTDTKAYRNRVLKGLRNHCLKLWKECVKVRARFRCEAEGCDAIEQLNAHHIEDYHVHPYLRYTLSNGLCLCPRHHKFGEHSAHKSFMFMQAMSKRFPCRFSTLATVIDRIRKVPQDEAYFEEVERKLNEFILGYK